MFYLNLKTCLTFFFYSICVYQSENVGCWTHSQWSKKIGQPFGYIPNWLYAVDRMLTRQVVCFSPFHHCLWM